MTAARTISPDPRPLDERRPRPAAGPAFLVLAALALWLVLGMLVIAWLSVPTELGTNDLLPDPCAVVQAVDATGAPAGWTVLDPVTCADAPVGTDHPAAVLGVLPEPTD